MKCLKITLFMFIFTTLLCITALAADNSGISDLSIDEPTKTTVTMFTASGTTPITAENGVYKGAERFSLTYNNAAAGRNYVLFVLNGAGTPTQENILYIDQAQANSSGILTFDNVYPMNVTSGGTVYIAGGDSTGLIQLASYEYFDISNSFTVSLSDETVQPGGTVTVDMNLNKNPGIGAMSLYVYYDPALLTYDNKLYGDIWNTHRNVTNPDGEMNTLSIAATTEAEATGYDDGDGINEPVVSIGLVTDMNLSANGNLLSLKFKVSDSITENITTDLILACIRSINNSNPTKNIYTVTKNGVINIQQYILGDVDNDKLITAPDALMALQISVGNASFTVTERHRLASDVDRDTYVTAPDALLILQRSVGTITSFD